MAAVIVTKNVKQADENVKLLAFYATLNDKMVNTCKNKVSIFHKN
jgi:hypothetical protein